MKLLGLCNNYRRFVSGYVNIAKALIRLTEESCSSMWCVECQEAYEISAPTLSYPLLKENFILDLNASNARLI